MEVVEVWKNVPPTWKAYIDDREHYTIGELIKEAVDMEDQLILSDVGNIQRMIRNEVQKQVRLQTPAAPKKYYNAHLADIPEDEVEEPTVTKEVLVSTPYKAPDKYRYPRANNRSKKTPPRPCDHCGSPLHYDNDCES